MSLQLANPRTSSTIYKIPQKIFDLYYYLERKFLNKKKWTEMHEKSLWYELCFCILSSNILYEQAQSATKYLAERNFLDPQWVIEDNNSQQTLAYELSKPAYLPNKKDGSFSKYRFPNVRAKNIVESAKYIYSKKSGLKQILLDAKTETDARDTIVRHIFGMGLKESSHFLRNIGYSSNLAIIDVHIISFLRYMKLENNTGKNITPRKYYELENKMREVAGFYGLNLSILDNAIWHYVKSTELT